MTTLLTAGMTMRMTVACVETDQVALNDFYWFCTAVAGASQTDAQAAAQLDATLAPLYKPALAALAEYYGVKIQIIDPLPMPIFATSTANTGPGTGAGGPVPGQVSGLVSLKTNLSGRANRGRLYIPFPAASFVEAASALPTVAYDTLLLAIANVLKLPFLVTTGADSATLLPMIWHRASRTKTPIVMAEESGKFATQRRRGNYGRPNTINPF
jgi:hypothetical protein